MGDRLKHLLPEGNSAGINSIGTESDSGSVAIFSFFSIPFVAFSFRFPSVDNGVVVVVVVGADVDDDVDDVRHSFLPSGTMRLVADSSEERNEAILVRRET